MSWPLLRQMESESLEDLTPNYSFYPTLSQLESTLPPLKSLETPVICSSGPMPSVIVYP